MTILRVLALSSLVLASCVTVSSVRDPQAPGPDWYVYSSVPVGLAVALPKTWRTFDLAGDDLKAAASLWARGESRGTVNLLPTLEFFAREAKVRFFAVESDPSIAGDQAAVAYASSIAAPPEGVDAFFSTRPQATGRQVTEQRHVSGSAGDMVVVRIEQRGPIAITQYQFSLVRGSRLHTLFIEFPTLTATAGGLDKALKIGLTFTPIGSQ